jgi:amidase
MIRGFDQYAQLDGVGLAELVSKGEVSVEEVCEAAISRIEKLDPRLNAIVTKTYDLARRAIGGSLPRGPLRGVPMLLKDLLLDCAGVVQTRACKALKDHVAKEDSELVRRYKAAGLVILGTTNTPEFGLLGHTEPELHGAT